MKRPLLVGITGGIGSGKSLICRVFSLLGSPVYYADDRAKWLMDNDPELKQSILHVFGEQSFTSSGLNRAFLAEKVFKNTKKLEQLNALVHPAVGRDFSQWVESNHHYPYLLKEAALIFETGSEKSLDYIINIAVPEQIRMARVLKRDPFRKEAQIQEIIKKQYKEEKREELADYTIYNDNTKLIIPEVLSLHQKFQAGNI